MHSDLLSFGSWTVTKSNWSCRRRSRNVSSTLSWNHALLQHRKRSPSSPRCSFVSTLETAYNVEMIFATNVPPGRASYLGTDASHYSHCGALFGESLFSFRTFYSKSGLWHAAWSSWPDCQWAGCDPGCSLSRAWTHRHARADAPAPLGVFHGRVDSR